MVHVVSGTKTICNNLIMQAQSWQMGGASRLGVSFEWCLPHRPFVKAAAGLVPQYDGCLTYCPCNITPDDEPYTAPCMLLVP